MDFDYLTVDCLKWMPELGIGYYEVNPTDYNEAYFQKYKTYEGSEIAEKLNNARVGLVKKFFEGRILDIGIGSGAFISAHGNADGFDINPAGIAWLKDRGIYREPSQLVEAVTFWDSFEHIRNPGLLLDHVKTWVFMSIPLFDGSAHVLRSKHYRKDEHYWYFTFNGLNTYMQLHGFGFVEFNRMETEIGREDIGTFVFKRKKA
jgi:hypothetical protein